MEVSGTEFDTLVESESNDWGRSKGGACALET